MRWAKQTVLSLYGEAQNVPDDKRPAFLSHVRRSESAGALANMVRLAESEAEVVARVGDFDADPMLFNVLNGTLDLRTGDLHEHRREDLIMKIAPVEHDPGVTCAVWNGSLKM